MSLDWDKFKERQYLYVQNADRRLPLCSNPAFENQCAIRVSSALTEAGWPFNGPNQPYTESRFGPLCEHGHARGATSLADYLEVYLAKPTRFVVKEHPITREIEYPVAGRYVWSNLYGQHLYYKALDYMALKKETYRRGIIYFNNPAHIDGFDLTDKTNTRKSYGIIGSYYIEHATEIRVFVI